MSWFPSALVGAATGVLSGFGVGGGTLLLLWLTLVQGMDQFQAGGVNLIYFAACALPALWGHLRRGLVDRPTALWSIATGVPACVAAAFFASSLDVTLRRRIFGNRDILPAHRVRKNDFAKGGSVLCCLQ